MSAPAERPQVAWSRVDNSRNWFLAILTIATIAGLGAAFGVGAGDARALILTVLAVGWVGYGLSHLTP